MTGHLSQYVCDFGRIFGDRVMPKIVKVPARVNLIGEHTDYNEGFVLPGAIDLYMYAIYSPRSDMCVAAYSNLMGELKKEYLNADQGDRSHAWFSYVFGTAQLIAKSYSIHNGINILIESEIPSGVGLSSSAALEVSTALALLDTNHIHNASYEDTARICQMAEHLYAGVRCGIMDQMTLLISKANHIIQLDCRTLEYKYGKFPSDWQIVVLTGSARQLMSSLYNTRRQESEQAVSILSTAYTRIRSLRDVAISDLPIIRNILPDTLFRRVRHVVSENMRVVEAFLSIDSHDLLRLADIFERAYYSLKEDFETVDEISSTIVDISRRIAPDVPTRPTGGGFGGSVISIVPSDKYDFYRAEMEKALAEISTAAITIASYTFTEGAKILEV